MTLERNIKAAQVKDLPQGMIITMTFEDVADKTKVTLRTSHPTVEDRKKHEEMGVVAGWNSSFECLDEHLQSCLTNETADREIVIRTTVRRAARDGFRNVVQQGTS